MSATSPVQLCASDQPLFATCANCGNDRFTEDRVITTKGAVVTFKTVVVCGHCRTPLEKS